MSPPKTPATDPRSENVSRRSLIVGAGFAMVAGGALAITPRRHERTLGQSRLGDIIPAQVGPWSVAPGNGLIMPEADEPSDVYDQVYARPYQGANVPSMMLLVAYGAAQSGLMKVHRPEVCYASSGFVISDDHPTDIPSATGETIAAKSFLATREDRTERVLYWTRISDAFPRDLNGQRLVMLELGVRGVIPDGVLVRCSTFGADASTGGVALQTFARGLISSAGPQGRELLIGGPRTRGPGGTASAT